MATTNYHIAFGNASVERHVQRALPRMREGHCVQNAHLRACPTICEWAAIAGNPRGTGIDPVARAAQRNEQGPCQVCPLAMTDAVAGARALNEINLPTWLAQEAKQYKRILFTLSGVLALPAQRKFAQHGSLWMLCTARPARQVGLAAVTLAARYRASWSPDSCQPCNARQTHGLPGRSDAGCELRGRGAGLASVPTIQYIHQACRSRTRLS